MTYYDASKKKIEAGISVVLPAYNEEENIDKCVETILEKVGLLNPPEFEIIVVNDGSKDSTASKVDAWTEKDSRVRAIHHPTNLGYANALRSGFSAATQPLVFYTDSDNQFDISEISSLLEWIDKYDIVTGFRIYRFDPLTRIVLSWGFNLIVRLSFRIDAKDIDCAFKLFRREAISRINIESKQFFVDAEVLAKAAKLGYRIKEIPVRHYPRAAGKSTIRPTHIPYTLWELSKMWIDINLRGKI